MLMMMMLALVQAAPGGAGQPEPVECRAQLAEVLVGERYRGGVPSRARKLSGASKLRVLWPGQMMTMDYRADRLNIRVDHRRLITAVSCG